MGDTSRLAHPNGSMEARVINNKKLQKPYLVASPAKGLSEKTLKCITLMKQGILNNGSANDLVIFFVTTAALEVVRRFSRAKCPFLWRGLQALQVLCYPPFKWFQRWVPFKGLIKHTQKLSRPMLVLTIATVFSDESAYLEGTSSNYTHPRGSPESQAEQSSQSVSPSVRSHDGTSTTCVSEKWLLELQAELRRQGISLPERLDASELRRFYDASNGDFSRLLSSVKRTIRWRQNYGIFSPQELEAWSHLVFWHGSDVKLRPCLIIRLGLACSKLRPKDRPLFVKAVVSRIEHGIVDLVNVEHHQITVFNGL